MQEYQTLNTLKFIFFISTINLFFQILDDIAPVLTKMFPRGNLKVNRHEHMLRVDLGYDSFEYWQMQVFKMISARRFVMRTSHASGSVNEKVNSVTYTFAR